MGTLNNIAEGWAKSLGLMSISAECRKKSKERIGICAKCPFAAQSSFLKIIKGTVENMAAIKCLKCGCPVNEKTLVIKEKCPEGKW